MQVGGLLALPAFELGGRFAHGDGMPRSSGSLDRMLCSSRIAEIPSTSEWCSFVYIATRPSRRPSMRCHSQSGRSVARRVLCSREHELEQLADPAGLGQRAVPDVVLDVELVVLDPDPLAGGLDRPVRAA